MQLDVPALERVVAQYRHDVNELAPPAPEAALQTAEERLVVRLPAGLRGFLALHNGARLFRGALRVRGTSELAAASEHAPNVILFAEIGVHGRAGVAVQWAFVGAGDFDAVFGRWENGILHPEYGSFAAWLAAEIAVVEADGAGSVQKARLRREAASGDAVHAVAQARLLLRDRDPAGAVAVLEECADPESHPDPTVWQLLGDARHAAGADPSVAWRRAFEGCTLPLPWPGAPCPRPDVVQCMAAAIDDPEEWEEVLGRFLHQRVADVTTAEEVALVGEVGRALARAHLDRCAPLAAHELLTELKATMRASTWGEPHWGACLDLAALEVRLCRHDVAEAHLRELRREGPADLQGQGLLLLVEIAVVRQEPWADEMARMAEAAGLGDDDLLRLSLLKVERAIRHQSLEQAEALLMGVPHRADASGDRRLVATTWMLRGDVARLSGRTAEAAMAYNAGFERSPNGFEGRETALRIALRRADLLRASGALDKAQAVAMAAAQGFAELGCTLREAWALVRVAAMVSGHHPERAVTLCQLARDRFEEADLASGIAAVDSMRGTPGASLPWHLERAADLARERHDAQRCRPPFHRADADRPERRLGAHRMAIAACDVGIVEALAAQMEACVRASRGGHSRATDPVVLRYVAAVDLLSAHRSYEAAEVLIAHHHESRIEGPMLRGLQGAIARSPNMTLVDGLLQCVESPQSHPSATVASAAELLGLRRERAALQPLIDLLELTRSAPARRAAILALGRIGHRAVVDAIVPSLSDPHLAEPTALALLMLGDRRGVDFHAQGLFDDRVESLGSPGEIVGRYGGPENLLLLMQAARGEDERALQALHGLGLLGDARGVPVLIEGLSGRQRRVVEVAAGALQILTGHVDDASRPGARGRWGSWWEAERHRFRPGVRYRHGRELDCGALIEGLSNRDLYVRRTSYDELVITSGQSLPFDADGPWRVQEAHIRAWSTWWNAYGEELPAGRWTLDGMRVN